jgi:uncharacterized protein (DUF736 family)
MFIGKFEQQNDGVYVGNVQALPGAKLAMRIAPTDLKGIDYLVTLSGTEIELGVGWNRVGEQKGTKYISVKLDSPFLPAPAWCSLFKQSDGSYNFVWNRPDPTKKKKAEPGAVEPAAA